MRKRFLWYIFFLFIWQHGVAQKSVTFQVISLEEGLSQSSVTCILQDHKGFLWFGTLDGLNRYDGYKVSIYRNQPDNPFSLPDNAITNLYQDSYNHIWIAVSNNGLTLYDHFTGRFFSFQANDTLPNSLSNKNINAFYEDVHGNLWIGTDNGLNKLSAQQLKSLNDKLHNSEPPSLNFEIYRRKVWTEQALISNTIHTITGNGLGNLWIGTDRGLNFFSADNEEFTSFRYNEQIPTASISNNYINDLLLDSHQTLWIATSNGLNALNTETLKFEHFKAGGKFGKSLCNNEITAIAVSENQGLWVGTNDGLSFFDFHTQQFECYQNNPFDNKSLSVNKILSLYIDHTNALWVGTSLGGVNKYVANTKQFITFRNNPFDYHSLSNNQVRCFMQQNDSIIWVGTENGGLNRWNLNTNSFDAYKHQSDNPNSLSHNHVRALLLDNDNNFWVGTDGGGLNLFFPKTGKAKQFRAVPDSSGTLPSDRIWAMFQDNQNRIWIGTRGGGLTLLNAQDPENPKFTVFSHSPDDSTSISANEITDIFQDSQNRLWIATYTNGLNLWVDSTQSFRRFAINPDDNQLDRIYSIIEDSNGELWLGTRGDLCHFDPETQTVEDYGIDYGFPNRVMMGIIDDNNGNLWVSTNSGLSKFNKAEKSVRNYNVSDGLQSNEYMIGSFLKTNSGRLLFGGINGFDTFYAEEINDNPNRPQIVITDFKLLNQTHEMDTLISEKQQINLKYNQNSFSFEFVAIDYTFSQKNQYAYKMEGLDEQWNYVQNHRYASYTNLPPGNYVFRVRGSNNDGLWNKSGTSIRIVIKPPFWDTIWFKIIAGVLILLLVLAFERFRDFIRDKNKLKRLVEERTAEIQKQKEAILEKNEELQQQQEEILTQRDELEIQRDIANQQKKDMTDSIHYALRIQSAILPPHEYLQSTLPDYFIFYKPRDIVSGDYYWVKRKGKLTIATAADCTGHGVPGAFVSMLGVTLLNEVINKTFEKHGNNMTANLLLDQLRDRVMGSLHQKMDDSVTADGMDMAICIINPDDKQLHFAGAYNPLYLIRNGELMETKADKMPVSASPKGLQPFTNHTLNYQHGDMIYMFSDGFIDQFGGPKNKKFKTKPFKRLLCDISHHPTSHQHQILEDTITEWSGANEQVDDIIVMGIRL